MKESGPEFDQFSESYEQLLKDPIRDRLAPGGTEFYHLRKRDVVRNYFRRRQMDTRRLAYLDLGCGKGELASLIRDDFARATGCGASAGMPRADDLISYRYRPGFRTTLAGFRLTQRNSIS